jgi:HEAT repeat protein
MGLFGPPNIEKLKANRDVEGLIKALEYQKDSIVRWNATQALGELGDVRAVQPLIAALKDQDQIWRSYLIRALCQIGDTRAIKPLFSMIKDRTSRQDLVKRSEFTDGLIKIGTPAVMPLIAALKDDDWVVRNIAEEALGNIGDVRAAAPLGAALENGLVDKPAIDALVKIGNPGMKPLVAALDNRDKKVCQAVTETLVKIGKPAIEPLIAATKDEKISVRELAVELLGKIGDASAVLPLITALEDRNGDVCEMAAMALGMLSDSRAVEPLIAAFTQHNTKFWQLAHDALVKIGAPAVEPLITALKKGNKQVRWEAAQTLKDLGWQPSRDENGVWYWIATRQWDRITASLLAVEPLLATLKDHDKDIREPAAAVLDQLGWRPGNDESSAWYCIVMHQWDQCSEIGAPAVEPLIAIIGIDADARPAARKALVKIGTPAVEPLIAALQNNNKDVRQDAATILGQFGDERALEPLIALLNDSYSGARIAAVEALGSLGDERILEPLGAVLIDNNKDVRLMAANALEKIGWHPEKDENGAWYWAARGHWDQCIDIGAPAIQPLISCLRQYDQDSARMAARTLVSMYHAGSLDEAQKNLILAWRGFMTSHTDKAGGSSNSNCFDWHADTPHTDDGLSVEFPL